MDIKSILARGRRKGAGRRLSKDECVRIIKAVLTGKKMYKQEFLSKVADAHPEECRTRDNAYQHVFEKEISKVCEELDKLEEYEKPNTDPV